MADPWSGHHVPLAYRVLLHGILAIIVVFFLFGSHITWINCITGFAWRAWPLLLAGRRTSVAVKATLLGSTAEVTVRPAQIDRKLYAIIPAHSPMISARSDVVGSLLRLPELLAAQKQLAEGLITPAEFKKKEDKAVDQAIALQEEAGLEVATDGEMRRQSFQSQMTAAVERSRRGVLIGGSNTGLNSTTRL